MQPEKVPGGLAVPLAVAGGVVALDQVTKALILSNLELHESLPVVDGLLNIVYARNPGAAFSLLADAPGWFRGPFFIGMTIVAIGAVLFVVARLPREDRILRVALGGVLGGAIGNLSDRLVHGEVIDFIDVHWRDYHWPAFNVADSSITLAVVAVILQSLLAGRVGERRSGASQT